MNLDFKTEGCLYHGTCKPDYTMKIRILTPEDIVESKVNYVLRELENSVKISEELLGWQL